MTSPNPVRGEVQVRLGKASAILCLTFAALAQLETAANESGPAHLADRLRVMGRGQLEGLVRAMLASAPSDVAVPLDEASIEELQRAVAVTVKAALT